MAKQYVDKPKSASGKHHSYLHHGPKNRRLPKGKKRATLQGLTPQQGVTIMGGTPGAYSGSKANIIAIGELGGGYTAQDVTDYFQSVGLPAPNVTWVDVGIGNGGAGGDAAPEVSLDYQWSGGIFSTLTGTPANIRIYGGNDFTPIMQAILKDIQAGMPIAVVSWSWGGTEASSGQSYCEQTDTQGFEPLRALGIPIGSAAGDNDYTDGGAGANTDFPASGPHGLACGGVSYINGQITVWNSGGGEGTGGGYSQFFPFSATAQPGAPTGPGRMVSDLAGLADPGNPGIANLTDGEWSPIGGTSAVGPMMAGIWAAILQKPSPTVDPQQIVWNHPECFTPVTSGTNGKYPGLVCCGLGTPWIDKLAAVVGNPQAPKTPAPLGPIPTGGEGGGGGTTGTGSGSSPTGTGSGSSPTGTGTTGSSPTSGSSCSGGSFPVYSGNVIVPAGSFGNAGAVTLPVTLNPQVSAQQIRRKLRSLLTQVIPNRRRRRRVMRVLRTAFAKPGVRTALAKSPKLGSTGQLLLEILAAALPVILEGLASGETPAQIAAAVAAVIMQILGV